MASMAEMVALQEQIAAQGVLIQQLQSRIDVQDEHIRSIAQEQSRPGSGGWSAPSPAVDLTEIEEVVVDHGARLLKLEVDAAKGKPGRKPKHVQEALKAEEAA